MHAKYKAAFAVVPVERKAELMLLLQKNEGVTPEDALTGAAKWRAATKQSSSIF